MLKPSVLGGMGALYLNKLLSCDKKTSQMEKLGLLTILQLYLGEANFTVVRIEPEKLVQIKVIEKHIEQMN